MSISGPSSIVQITAGLLPANNLSDVASASTARTNLGLGSAAEADTTDFAAALGADDNYVTDAEKTKLSNLSGTNTGDQDLSGLVPNTRTVNGHALSSNVTVSKSDVGLGNVTNDAQVPASYLDTDGTLAANSDTKVATQKATKTYADTKVKRDPQAADATFMASLSWAARFRASDLSGNDGDTVATFTDISGNGNNAAGSGSTRVLKKAANGINGKAVVRLASAGYFATSAGGQQFSGEAFYLAAVVRFNTDGATQHVLCLGEDSTGKRRGLIRYSTDVWGYNGNSADVPTSAFQELTVSTPYFLELISDGTTITCLRDGVVMIAQPIGQTAYTNDVISLGKNNGSSEFLQGDLAEVLLAAGADVPSLVERELIRDYIATEYGITMPTYTGDSVPLDNGTGLADSGIYSDGAAVVVGDGAPATWGSDFGIEQLARVSVYGPIYAYNSRGEHLLESDDYYTNGTSANVLALRHKSANGASAVRFLLASDGGEVGACGYVNGTGTYLSGSAYLAGSVPYPLDGSTVSSGDPAGVILGQEGFYAAAMRRVARVYCKPDWTIEFRDPLDNVVASISPTGDFTIGDGSAIATTATAGFFRLPSCAGTPTGAAPNDSLIHDSTNGALYLRSGGAWVAIWPGAGSGDVVGPASATDGNFPQFDTTTGKLLKNSSYGPTSFVAANSSITGATKTKVTYDAKGLVTAGADATTADIADSTNKRYVTDAQLTVIGNTSGTNTGDQTTVSGNAGTATTLQTSRNIDGQAFNGSADITVIAPGTHAATGKTTPVDADEIPLVDSAASNVLKKLTWANLKATAKAYFDTLYQAADSELSALAGLTSAANKGIQFTGSGTAATYDLTTAGKALLDDADASAQRTTLGLAAVAASGSASDLSSGTLDPARLQPMRRKTINGCMRIDQQFAGAASNSMATLTYPVDQWCYVTTQSGKFNGGRNLGSGTLQAGFPFYLGLSSTSSFSGASTDTFSLYHDIEGYDVADLAWGTADAKTVTLSLYVYSSQTGTFGGSIQNSGATRSYPFSFTISSSNTWERKTVTITGDTSGTWLTTNGIGLAIQFDLGCGSNFSGTAATWAGADYRTVSGATKIVATNAATYRITGVQLEIGSLASPYEYRPMGQEFLLCQRYYRKSYALGTAVGSAPGAGLCSIKDFHVTGTSIKTTPFGVSMRAAPTVTIFDGAGTSGKFCNFNGSWNNNATVADKSGTESSLYVDCSLASSYGTNFDYSASARMR